MKTMYPPGYHHRGFVATHALGSCTWAGSILYIYIYTIYIYIYIYIYVYVYILYSEGEVES